MPKARRSASAARDCDEIWDYIASDNVDAADRVLRLLAWKLDLYATHPGMGTRREELARGLRSFPVGNYLAFYRIVPGGIELVRVLHGARDLKKLFS